VRRRPLRGERRIPVRVELPLFELPPGAGIERHKLRIAEGDDKLMIVGEESSHDARCATCGSLLWSVVRDGAFVHVTLGTLVDAPGLRPTAHIYVGSKAPWFTITDDLPQHQELG
jgi:hypothetical protein